MILFADILPALPWEYTAAGFGALAAVIAYQQRRIVVLENREARRADAMMKVARDGVEAMNTIASSFK